jgi:bla regulator protein blaR1
MIQWLTDTFFATSALLLLVLLIRGPVARSFGASISYWLWLLPALRLFMPPLTEVISVPVTKAEPSAAVDLIALNAPIPAAVAERSFAMPIDWTNIGLSVWLGGAALLFIAQMLRYVALRDELLSDAKEIDRIGDIRVVETDRIGGPLAFGLFRRYIAVPDHFTRTFSNAERDLALAHELAHHRSGDLYANLAAFIFLCLQWFNPLAWMAWSAFRFDQEAACDARVLAGADASTRQSYGRALARAATVDAVPALAMAMAQNSPRTIIERLRRLMMKDTSKRRLMAGRAAIFAAAAIALPLTATVVPVFATDKAEPVAAEPKKQTTKVIMIKSKDGEDGKINVTSDPDTPFVKTIEKDGKTIVLRSTKELSDADVEKMIANIDVQHEKAEKARDDAEDARENAMQAGAEAEAEASREYAEEQRIRTISILNDMDFDNLIPDIDVRELRRNCKDGQDVTTDVRGFDSKDKATIIVSVCGKGRAKLARGQALDGMRQALKELEGNKDIPDSIRKSVLDSMEKQIDRMEKEQEADDSESDA